MAQTGYVPISLYYSTTAATAPTAANLVSGELAINITDGILFYKDNAGVVQTLATKAATSGSYTSITLTGGTANGVPYLNASKVLTTGTALTFDGTNLGVGGIITMPNNVAFKFKDSGGTARNTFYLDASNNLQIQNNVNNGNVAQTLYGTGVYLWSNSSTELMRLTSTGLGIGTSSPSQPLTVGGTGNILVSPGATFFSSGRLYIRSGSGQSLDFGANGTNSLMQLDSSGNLGLGVTPSAWGSPFKAFQLGVGGSLSGQTDNYTTTQMSSNAYYSSGWKYIAATSASQYAQSSGQHIWNIAAAGTAGAAISFTQAMTLDASGRLGIGTTSVSTALEVFGARQSSTIKSIINGFDTQATAADVGGGVGLGGKYDASNYAHFALVGGRKENGTSGNYAGYMVFETRPNGGELTERARIDSSGNLLVGNTTGAGKLYVETTSTTAASTKTVATSTSYTGTVLTVECSRDTSNATYYLIKGSRTGVADVFRVADSGNVTNTNGSYGTISDAKMKTDIVDAGSQWSDIKAIRFRKFKMKDDPEQRVQLGVVAQELEQTSPGLVEEHADRDAEGNDLGTVTKSVKTSILLMKAAVALQEAMARIEQLETRVAQLEGK